MLMLIMGEVRMFTLIMGEIRKVKMAFYPICMVRLPSFLQAKWAWLSPIAGKGPIRFPHVRLPSFLKAKWAAGLAQALEKARSGFSICSQITRKLWYRKILHSDIQCNDVRQENPCIKKIIHLYNIIKKFVIIHSSFP